MLQPPQGYTVLEKETNEKVTYPTADSVTVENGYLFVVAGEFVLAVYPTHTWVNVKRNDATKEVDPMVQLADMNFAGLSDEKVSTYPWIIAYGMLQSYPPKVIRADMVRAIQTGAPPTVLCHNGDGIWTTLASISIAQAETRLWLLDYAWSRDMVIPYEVLKVWLDPSPLSFLDQSWTES